MGKKSKKRRSIKKAKKLFRCLRQNSNKDKIINQKSVPHSPQRNEDPIKIPQILYKYFSFNAYNNIETLFEQHKIYFCSSNFNDPFDCKLNINFNLSEDDKWKFADQMSKDAQRLEGRPYETSFPVYYHSINQPNIKDKIEPIIQQSAFLCVSENSKNILMWAHYASAHSGICIGFNFEGYLDRDKPRKVIYSEKYPKFKFSIQDLVEKILITKSVHWAYENEWRLSDRPPGFKDIHPRRIKEVIFGCNITAHNKLKVLQMLKSEEFSHVVIFQAIPSKNRFELELELLDINNLIKN